MKKTNFHIRREAKATKLGYELAGTGVDVQAWKNGYAVIIKCLNEKQLRRILPLVVVLRDKITNPSGVRKDGSLVDIS